MIKKTRLDLIGFDVGDDPASQGDIALRFAKLTYAEDGTLVAREHHRTMLSAGDDIDAHLARVNEHLACMGFGAISADHIDDVKHAASRKWTPEVLAVREQRKADDAAAFAAEQERLVEAAAAAATEKQAAESAAQIELDNRVNRAVVAALRALTPPKTALA